MKTYDVTPQAEVLLNQLGLQYECSEVGNMERFVAQHKDTIRFIPECKSWAFWDNTRWNLSGHSRVFAKALETAKSIYDEARDCENEEGRKQVTN